VSPSGRGQEPQDIAHDALPLIGLKEKLRVRGAIEDDQFLGLGRSLVLCPDAWQGDL
jgi:hypothetical protein